MHKRNALVSYRLVFGLLALSALVTEISVLVQRGKFVPSNFFSYFTVEANLLAAGMLLVSAFMLSRGTQSRALTMLRGASTLYMAITGIIFVVFLSGLENVQFTVTPWDNIVLHYIMPLAVVVDWFLDLPKKSIAFRKALLWLVFPVVYLLYSLIRGNAVGWYPYPFLNPAKDGYLGVAIVSVIISAAAVLMVWALIVASRHRSK